jgi:hypothetical protein
MNKYLILTLVLGVLLIVSCVEKEVAPVCNKPYILVGTACCLDTDENGICDSDESDMEEQEEGEEMVAVEEDALDPCHEKAMELIPKNIYLTLHGTRNPNTSLWEIKEMKWIDEEEVKFKGDLKYEKGKSEGENINYWYMRNYENEKLFGEGGFKYSKKVIIEGESKTNEFIIKPVLEEFEIIKPELTSDRYRGNFKILDYNFVSCQMN